MCTQLVIVSTDIDYMDPHLATLMLMYDGTLSVDENFFPSYTGGRNRQIQVSVSTTLNDLKNRILISLNCSTTSHTVQIICRVPIDISFVASHITDEESCAIVLQNASV